MCLAGPYDGPWPIRLGYFARVRDQSNSYAFEAIVLTGAVASPGEDAWAGVVGIRQGRAISASLRTTAGLRTIEDSTMLNPVGQPTQLRSTRPPLSNADAAYARLLDALDPAEDTRVLLIGSDTLELMCALIHRGCTSVTTLRPADRPERASADIVVVSHAVAAKCADETLAQARRALVPLGSLVLCLPGTPSLPLVQHLNRSLRLHGFSSVRTTTLAGLVLLRAEVPLFGSFACAA